MSKKRKTIINYTPQNYTAIKDASGKWIPLRNFADIHESDDTSSAEDENARKKTRGKIK